MKTGGREAGVPNKVTQEQREAFQHLLDANREKLQAWIDDVAKTDPYRAFNMVMDLAAHCVPKMKAIEVSQHPSAPLPILLVQDGYARIPDGYPGPAVHINSPDYNAEHPTHGPVVRFIDPPDPNPTDR